MVGGVEENAVGWVVRLVVGAALEATDHLSALISPVRGRTGLLEKIGEGYRCDIRFFLKLRLANQKFLYGII